ncbi:redox-sensing transcriptional repressor Rex [Tomitella biformata]|uniref:redox-sensing transcriptional repressor Rex n=1 Tax=Tomitella biformata TaxID=630403 RepID=UPI0004BA3112
MSPQSGVSSADAASSGQPAVANRRTAPHPGLVRDIPKATVGRLASYLRALSALADDGIARVSSEQLADATAVGSATLRKDLSFLGSQGVRGVGYEVASLTESIESALGLDLGHRVVLVGVGNLGLALTGHGGFGRRGFTVVALFDIDPAKVGTTVRGLRVRHLDELPEATADPESIIGVIATPPDAAQQACDRLVAAGVQSILNFAPVVLKVPENIEMRRVDLAVEMQVLSFGLARNSRRDTATVTR